MAPALENIREEIRGLSKTDKEALLRSLWEELDGPTAQDVEAAWLAEACRRDDEMEEGLVQSVFAEEVFKRLRHSPTK
jgi:putative addiction module component (TIGR02574 family)